MPSLDPSVQNSIDQSFWSNYTTPTPTQVPVGSNAVPVPSTTTPTMSNQFTPLPPLQTSPINLQTTGYTGTPINGADFTAQSGGVLPNNGLTPAQYQQQLAAQLGTGLNSNSIGQVQDINSAFATPTFQNPTTTSLDSISRIMDNNNPYMQNAYRRGLENAGARGLLNSSISGGTAQRAAIESAMPIFNQAMNLQQQQEAQQFQASQNARAMAGQFSSQNNQNTFNSAQNMLNNANQMNSQRENLAFQGQQNDLNRTQNVNQALLDAQLRERQMGYGAALDSRARAEQLANQFQVNQQQAIQQQQLNERSAALQSQMQYNTALQQDWLANNAYNRNFYGTLATLPIQSAASMYQMLAQNAMQQPDVFTPDVISGFTNFFSNDMRELMRQYFGGNA